MEQAGCGGGGGRVREEETYIGRSQHPNCPSMTVQYVPMGQHPASGHSMDMGQRKENVLRGSSVPGTVFVGFNSPSSPRSSAASASSKGIVFCIRGRKFTALGG